MYERALLFAADADFRRAAPASATTLSGEGPMVTGDPVFDAWERALWDSPEDDDQE